MRILLPVHQYLPRHTAGVEVYTHSLAKALRRRHEVLVYCHEPAMDGGDVQAVEEEFDGITVHRVAAYPHGAAPRTPVHLFWLDYRNRFIEADYYEVLRRFSPHVVHVQHLKGLSAGIVEQTASAGIPVIMTLHDYWAICPNAQFVRPGGTICRGTHLRLECGRCAAYRLGSQPLQVAAPAMAPLFLERDRRVRQSMEQVAMFISPSAFLRDHYLEEGFPPTKFCVLEYGLDPTRLAGCRQEGRGAFRGHYAYIGSLAWQKGVHVLLDAFRGLGDSGAQLRVWGNPEVFPNYAARLRELAQGHHWINLEGPLDSAHIGEALDWADYLIVPSVWWENSPVTILEAYYAGVPVIASRLGALPEKVEDGVSGLLFEPGNPADLRRVILRTIHEPELLMTLRRGLPQVIEMHQHASLLEGLYAQALAGEPV